MRTTIATVVLSAWIGVGGAAFAGVRLPAEAGPFYARIERGLIHWNEEWAAITFYRAPECVREDFNLLDFFDIPACFACASTVTAFEIWKNGPPPLDAAPIQVRTIGLGSVPVWFVSRADLESAIADDALTIGELWALPSLRVGAATSFTETLHPAGGARRTMLQIVAQGMFSDGSAFTLHVTEVDSGLKELLIDFE